MLLNYRKLKYDKKAVMLLSGTKITLCNSYFMEQKMGDFRLFPS